MGTLSTLLMNRKILIISYEFPPIIGGAGVYAHDLAIGLALNNCEVDVVTYRSSNTDIKRNLKNNYDINVFDFTARKGVHFIQFFICIKKLTVSNQYDLIILSDGRAKRVFALFMFALKIEIKKSISVFHGDEINSFFIKPSKSIRFLRLDKKLLHLFSLQRKLVTVSQKEKELWHEFLPDLSDKLITVLHGINEDMFYPRIPEQIMDIKTSLKISKEKKIIVSASRLAEKKGQDNLLRAFSEVNHDDLILLIIGDGEYLETLKTISENIGISEHVRFVGAVDRNTLSRYYAIADLFVLVSRYHESFGLVYLEAAACGVPSICGNLGGVRDAVIDGETGVVVDSFDISELRNKIIFLLNNEHYRKELATNALNRYRQGFTSTVMANNLINYVQL